MTINKESGGDMVADREPYWDECDDSGKIERMRRIVKQMECRIRTLEHIVSRLKEHDHINGKIFCKMETLAQQVYSNRPDDYF